MTGTPVETLALTPWALPGPETVKAQMKELTGFHSQARRELIQGVDYGIIPGTERPTLLKPGAEKVAKILGLADTYSIVAQVEDWDRPLFHYLVKCHLTTIGTGLLIAEGVGSCNSMEGRYRYRWVFESQLPPKMTIQDILVTRTINTARGRATQYQVLNGDIYSQVNTILKMAKKRSLVDAALSAGQLSNLFTQDMEDIHEEISQSSEPPAPSGTVRQPVAPKAPRGSASAQARAGRELTPLAAKLQAVVGPLGISPEEVNAYCRGKFNDRPWGKLTEDEQGQVAEYYQSLPASQANAPEEIEMTGSSVRPD